MHRQMSPRLPGSRFLMTSSRVSKHMERETRKAKVMEVTMEKTNTDTRQEESA